MISGWSSLLPHGPLTHAARKHAPLAPGERCYVARWESRGGKWWVMLYHDAHSWGYTGAGCGGSFPMQWGQAEAFEEIEGRLGEFQPDDAKTPMRRIW